MENKNLEQKLIDAKNLILRGLTAGLAIVTMYSCGEDDNSCIDDGDCKNGYECKEVCTSSTNSCGRTETTSTTCGDYCQEKDSTKKELTNNYNTEKEDSIHYDEKCAGDKY